MTPPNAWVPYNAAAEAPFSTEMFSISLGLMSFRRDSWLTPLEELLPRVSLLMGTPSSTMRGWLLRVIEEIPRIWMYAPAPGSPELRVIRMPEDFPDRALMRVDSPAPAMARAETWELAYPSASLFSRRPSAVTTTSSSTSLSSSRLSLISVAEPTRRRVVSIPT